MCRSSHRRYSVKKVVLEILQNSQKNTCARDSFLIKLQTSLARCFPVTFVKFLTTAFLQNTSGRLLLNVKNTCFKISQHIISACVNIGLFVNIGIKGCFNKTFLLKDETMLVKMFYTTHLYAQAFKVKHWKHLKKITVLQSSLKITEEVTQKF